jgi:hypothetical protein
MRIISLSIIYIAIVCLSSCNNHKQEVDVAIAELELIDSQLDRIGEQSIRGYKTTIYLAGINDHEYCDSITISEREFREIQSDIYAVKENLEELSKTLAKESEGE